MVALDKEEEPDLIHSKDSVPTKSIRGRVMTYEEKRAWMEYNIFVLQPRVTRCQVRARKLQRKPWRSIAWLRNMKEWIALTERQEAILKIRTIGPPGSP